MKKTLPAAMAYLFCAIACLFSATAAAQNWPEKPIRIISAYPPGGAADLLARLVNNRMKELLGQPVVVENRGGAGGAIGMDAMAKSAPDGHTLAFSAISPVTLLPHVGKVPYDALRDIAPAASEVMSRCTSLSNRSRTKLTKASSCTRKSRNNASAVSSVIFTVYILVLHVSKKCVSLFQGPRVPNIVSRRIIRKPQQTDHYLYRFYSLIYFGRIVRF